MRAVIRNILTYIFFGIVLAIVVAVAAEWFIEVARDKGFFAAAGQRWDKAMGLTLETVKSAWVIVPLTGFGGVIAGLWVDKWLRRREMRGGGSADGPSLTFDEMQAKVMEDTRELYAITRLPIVERKNFFQAHVLLDGKHFIGCSFEQCTLEFNGGPVTFSECKMKNDSNKFISQHPAVNLANFILRAAGFIRQDSFVTTIPMGTAESVDLPTITQIKDVNDPNSPKNTP